MRPCATAGLGRIEQWSASREHPPFTANTGTSCWRAVSWMVKNPDASSSKGNRAHKVKVPGLIDEGPSCQFPKVYETKGCFVKIPVVLSIRDGKPKWVEAKRGSGVWCGKFLWVWDTKRCGPIPETPPSWLTQTRTPRVWR